MSSKRKINDALSAEGSTVCSKDVKVANDFCTEFNFTNFMSFQYLPQNPNELAEIDVSKDNSNNDENIKQSELMLLQ